MELIKPQRMQLLFMFLQNAAHLLGKPKNTQVDKIDLFVYMDRYYIGINGRCFTFLGLLLK